MDSRLTDIAARSVFAARDFPTPGESWDRRPSLRTASKPTRLWRNEPFASVFSTMMVPAATGLRVSDIGKWFWNSYRPYRGVSDDQVTYPLVSTSDAVRLEVTLRRHCASVLNRATLVALLNTLLGWEFLVGGNAVLQLTGPLWAAFAWVSLVRSHLRVKALKSEVVEVHAAQYAEDPARFAPGLRRKADARQALTAV